MQVPQPYIPNTVSNVTQNSKDEADMVGSALDAISTEVSDPNLEESLLKISANYKFMGNNGTFDQSYLNDETKQYGIISTGSKFVRGVRNAANKFIDKITRPNKNDVEAVKDWGDKKYERDKKSGTQSTQPQQQSTKPVHRLTVGRKSPQPNQTAPAPVTQPQPVPQSNQLNDSQRQQLQAMRDEFNNRYYLNGSDKIGKEAYDTIAVHNKFANQVVQDPSVGMSDPSQVFDSGNVEGDLLNRLTTMNGLDNARVVNGNGKVNKSATYEMHDNIYDNASNAVNHWYMDKTGKVNENWRKAGQQALKNATPMQMKNNQFLSQIARTYSNNKMIKLDNIRFFSDSSKEIIVKMYADQLSEEEIQSALKWKNRKQKLIKALKTIGGIGLAGAALYGGAKWYQNGGKEYLSKVGDTASDFLTKTGDAAVDAGKGIGNATKDEADRIATKLAEKQLEGKEVPEDTKPTDTKSTEEVKTELPKVDDNYETEYISNQFHKDKERLQSELSQIEELIQYQEKLRDQYLDSYKRTGNQSDMNMAEGAMKEITELGSQRDQINNWIDGLERSMGKLKWDK